MGTFFSVHFTPFEETEDDLRRHLLSNEEDIADTEETPLDIFSSLNAWFSQSTGGLRTGYKSETSVFN